MGNWGTAGVSRYDWLSPSHDLSPSTCWKVFNKEGTLMIDWTAVLALVMMLLVVKYTNGMCQRVLNFFSLHCYQNNHSEHDFIWFLIILFCLFGFFFCLFFLQNFLVL